LNEGKDLIDSVPQVLKKDVKKEEAKQIKDVLTKVGAVKKAISNNTILIVRKAAHNLEI
jgi:ribosomal protein L7/L12